MTDNELLQAIRQVVADEVSKQIDPLKTDIASLQTAFDALKRGQSKMQAQIQGAKAEMHERFDKLETVSEYALKEIDYLDQAYKQL